MKRLILLSTIITWAITLAAQQDKTILSPTTESLFIKHVNLLTQETKIWEVKSDRTDFPDSNFVPGFDGSNLIQTLDENKLKSMDLVEKITMNPQHPERTILLCTNKLEDKMTSAVMIAPRHILATGKSYYSAAETPEQIFFSSFDCLKKLNSYEFAYATDIYFFSRDPNDFQNDLAVMTLDRPLGAIIGWMGYGYHTNNNYYSETTFSLTNLNYYQQNAYELHKYAAKADMVQENALYFAPYKNLTPGAPLYNQNGTTVGIVSHWARTYGTNGDTTYYDGVSRISPQKYNTITSIIDEDTPTEPDVMPLRITVKPNKIKASEQLEQLTYRLFNGSKATFEGDVQLDIYLSSDNLINSKDLKITSLGGPITLTPNYFVTASANEDLTIPLNVKPGKYYVGAILTAPDSNLNNNTTNEINCDTLIVENLLATNYISGKIITTAEYSGEGYCLLLQYSDNNLGTLYDIVEVDENLNFEFENIFIGKYIIVYIPSKSNNIYTPPTYYNQTPYWENATVLEFGLSDTVRNVNISRIELPPLNGNKTISGHLSIMETKEATVENENFFADVSIIVENPLDQSIFGFCYPDNNGFYQLKNLTDGSYDILIDKPGYMLEKKHSIVISSEMDEVGNLNFMFNADSTIQATNTTNSPWKLSKNLSFDIYPNPTSNVFKIKTNLADHQLKSIKIYNTYGQIIKTIAINNFNTTSIDVKSLPAGIYYIIVATIDNNYSKILFKK